MSIDEKQSTNEETNEHSGQAKDSRDDKDNAYMFATPDKGWAWVVALASMFLTMLGLGTYHSMGIVQVELIEVFEASASVSSLLFTAGGLVWCLSAIFVSTALAGVLHERGLVIIGTTLGAIGFITTSFANNVVPVVLVLGCFSGAAAQLLLAASLSIIGRYFKKRLGLANGMLVAGASVGTMLIAPVMRFLQDEYTVSGALLIYGAIVLNGFVCAALLRPVNVPTTKQVSTLELFVRSIPIRPVHIPRRMSRLEINYANLEHTQSADTTKVQRTIVPERKSIASVEETSNGSTTKQCSSPNGKMEDGDGIAYINIGYEEPLDDTVHRVIERGPSMKNGGPSTPYFNAPKDDPIGVYWGRISLDNETDSISMSREKLSPGSPDKKDEVLKICSGNNVAGVESSIVPIRQRICGTVRDVFVISTGEHRLKCSLREVCALNLFKNPAFVLFQLYTLFVNMTGECFIQFYPAIVDDIGIPKVEAALLLSIVGASNTCSRLLIGWFADLDLIARYKLMIISHFVLGLACNLLFLGVNFWSQAIFAVTIGFQLGIYNSLRFVVLIEFFGLDNYAKSLGVNLAAEGASLMLGSPLIGWLKDFTGGYLIPLHILGTLCLLSGFLLGFIAFLKNFQSHRQSSDTVDEYDINDDGMVTKIE